MQIENLREQDVEGVKYLLDELKKKDNPDIKYHTYGMTEMDIAKQYEEIVSRLDVLESVVSGLYEQIKRIFGNAILINGKFVALDKLPE